MSSASEHCEGKRTAQRSPGGRAGGLARLGAPRLGDLCVISAERRERQVHGLSAEGGSVSLQIPLPGQGCDQRAAHGSSPKQGPGMTLGHGTLLPGGHPTAGRSCPVQEGACRGEQEHPAAGGAQLTRGYTLAAPRHGLSGCGCRDAVACCGHGGRRGGHFKTHSTTVGALKINK